MLAVTILSIAGFIFAEDVPFDPLLALPVPQGLLETFHIFSTIGTILITTWPGSWA
jgi:hypothetical protein